MRRRLFILATGAALGASAVPAWPADVDFTLSNGSLGADLSGGDFQGVLAAVDPQALAGTSLAVSHAASASSHRVILTNLPPVMNQGPVGACEAASAGYCLGAYTAARNPNGSIKWSTADAANQPSAAWLYNWLHQPGHASKCPGPSGPVQYVQKLIQTGAPSNAADPYNPSSARTSAALCASFASLDPNDPGADASHFLIGSYKVFPNVKNRQSQLLEAFRVLIRNGHAIQFSGLCGLKYLGPHPPLTNGVYAPTGFIPNSGHGQVIVGFDDSRGANGAFLVQNSFGPKWNPGPTDDPGYNGRIWYDYESWFAGQSGAVIMFPNLDGAPSGTHLTASAQAPKLFIREGMRFVQQGTAYLAIVLHGTDALTLRQFSITGPRGKTTSQKLNEVMRFGYVYAQRKAPFKAGKYTVALEATTPAGNAVTYKGKIEIA